ncbi:MAG: cold shock domain-containing protein [Ramlibacter sp.]|nr:cold shock domain-containing protein [Ramlibacter sp.]MCW5648591.1 cold shock domain-containing protein [Ramlibacter sp.]
MRFTGKIHTWNEERGFGFIRPTDGGQDIFVHVSSVPCEVQWCR